MQTGPKATDNPRDFVVVPSDQVRVAPSDAEITDLLRAAARHHSETGTRATTDPFASAAVAAVPAVDATFRATDVNEGVPAKGSFIRRAMRTFAALLLALGYRRGSDELANRDLRRQEGASLVGAEVGDCSLAAARQARAWHEFDAIGRSGRGCAGPTGSTCANR